VGFTPAADRAIAVGEDGVISVWNLRLNRLERRSHLPAEISSAALSPDGLRVAATVKNQVAIWEIPAARRTAGAAR
jgi:hypothetical protein